MVKGTVSEVSSDPPCRESNARLTTVHFKALSLIKYKLDINVYNLEN